MQTELTCTRYNVVDIQINSLLIRNILLSIETPAISYSAKQKTAFSALEKLIFGKRLILQA
jgi:hypothetical protein